LQYFEYLIRDNYAELERSLLANFDLKKIPERNADSLIEGMLFVTEQDKKKKLKSKNYYECNAACFILMFKSIFSSALYHKISQPDTLSLTLHNYSHILQNMLFDIDYLAELFRERTKCQAKQNYQNYRKSGVHFFELHQMLRQTLYGQRTCHSFDDLEISASIPVIRQLIELRIRWAFGVLSFVDAKGNQQPLALSRLFEVLRKHKSTIQTPIKLENIERIYKWANITVHSGCVDHTWVPLFLETVLKELSMGKGPTESGFDVKNGIVTDRATIASIHQELANDIPQGCLLRRKGRPRMLYTCEPQCILTH